MADPESPPKPTAAPGWTLGAIRGRNLELETHCLTPDCGTFLTFDLDALIARVGPDYRLPEGPGFPCPACDGELVFKLATHPPKDATD
jgi:hypothetical protein